ncbi:hypothetical protein GCM10022204_26640 [Microlunatus aurantiacus]|uniref:Uncharacterized protein n=1 Tax=Microlunatus aurantiacus TaxID=446786 RepID=A0ABP7DPU7_9ACTN
MYWTPPREWSTGWIHRRADSTHGMSLSPEANLLGGKDCPAREARGNPFPMLDHKAATLLGFDVH